MWCRWTRKPGLIVSGGNSQEPTKGFYKLAGAARAFGFDFRGKVVMDIGSSTGGFTEYALEAGAEKVIAIEKGTRQMRAPLRDDVRVELHEKTDVMMVWAGEREMTRAGEREKEEAVQVEEPDVIVADVSFVSLEPILRHVKEKIAGENTDMLMMLKPQFEAEPRQLVNGVVKNEKMRREIIKKFERWLKQSGFLVVKKRDNDVWGKNGNKERFYWLKLVKHI